MPSELRLGTVSLAQGLATSKKLKIDVRLRNISDMKGACGPPKIPNFKPPQKITKVTLPDWLIKWQKKSNEQPPEMRRKK